MEVASVAVPEEVMVAARVAVVTVAVGGAARAERAEKAGGHQSR